MHYQSCEYIEHGIIFTWRDVLTCCFYNSDDKKHILFDKYFTDKNFSIEEIMRQKKEIREKFKNGGIFSGCKNCHNLTAKDWDDEDYINLIYISHFTKCAVNCFYCYYGGQKQFFQKFKNAKILPLLKAMHSKGIFRTDNRVIITGGEPSELDELDEIIYFLIKNNEQNIVLNSSGLQYKQSIADALKKDITELTVSLDSGDRELYKKIKRIDKFEQVISNIKKYIQAQNVNKSGVRMKYILLPGINTSFSAVQKWLDLCIDLGIRHIILDIETYYYSVNKNNIPKHIHDIIKYIEDEAAKHYLTVSYYSNVLQLKHEARQQCQK